MLARALLLLLAAHARADVVKLVNGDTVTGIVMRTSDAGLDVQIDDEGFVALSSATVASVKRQSQKENKAIAERWRAERRQAEGKDRDDKRFAAEQRKNGLVLFHGEWVTPEEAREALAEKELDMRYGPTHAQAFITHEAEPPLMPAPESTFSGVPAVYNYYYFTTARPSRLVTFQDGHFVTSQ